MFQKLCDSGTRRSSLETMFDLRRLIELVHQALMWVSAQSRNAYPEFAFKRLVFLLRQVDWMIPTEKGEPLLLESTTKKTSQKKMDQLAHVLLAVLEKAQETKRSTHVCTRLLFTLPEGMSRLHLWTFSSHAGIPTEWVLNDSQAVPLQRQKALLELMSDWYPKNVLEVDKHGNQVPKYAETTLIRLE